MEETCALLQEEHAPAAAPVASSRRRDVVCFVLGCATAAVVAAAMNSSARRGAGTRAVTLSASSELAALKAQIAEKDNALSLSLMELDRVRAVAATGDAGSSGCWEWVCPTPAPSPVRRPVLSVVALLSGARARALYALAASPSRRD